MEMREDRSQESGVRSREIIMDEKEKKEIIEILKTLEHLKKMLQDVLK